MKAKITQKLINSLEPQAKPYRVYDTDQPGFYIRRPAYRPPVVHDHLGEES